MRKQEDKGGQKRAKQDRVGAATFDGIIKKKIKKVSKLVQLIFFIKKIPKVYIKISLLMCFPPLIQAVKTK